MKILLLAVMLVLPVAVRAEAKLVNCGEALKKQGVPYCNDLGPYSQRGTKLKKGDLWMGSDEVELAENTFVSPDFVKDICVGKFTEVATKRSSCGAP